MTGPARTANQTGDHAEAADDRRDGESVVDGPDQGLIAKCCGRHATQFGEMDGQARRDDRGAEGDAESLAVDSHLSQSARRRPDPYARHGTENGAAVGTHEHSLAHAEQDEAPDEVRQREVRRQPRQAQESQDHDCHSGAGGDARAEAVRGDAAQRRHESHSDRNRRQQQAGLDRREASPLLEQKRQQEGCREQAGERNHDADQPRGEWPDPEQGEIDHRLEGTSLRDQEGCPEDDESDQQPDNRRAGPAPLLAVAQGQQEAEEGGAGQHRASHVKSLALPRRLGRKDASRPDDGQHADRGVDQEDGTPRGHLGKEPAQNRPQTQADGHADCVEAQSAAALIGGEGPGHDRRPHGHDHRRAQSLDDSERHQPDRAGSGTAADARQREKRETD